MTMTMTWVCPHLANCPLNTYSARCQLASMTFICQELSMSVKVRVSDFYLSKAVKVKVNNDDFEKSDNVC